MIFPIPKEYEERSGVFSFKSRPNADDLYRFYRDCLSSEEIAFSKDLVLGKEAYVMQIGEYGVKIASSCEEGAFRAVTSLYQLYKKGGGAVNFASIEDRPDFERRAYMLDISRGRVPKPETIKKLIDILALLKYNEFQLYMENFCFQYPLFPEVTEGFDCLTVEDIKELERYCRDRFIDLVPNQNCLGHMGAWLEREEYQHLEVSENGERTYTINPLLEESNRLIDKIFDSLLPYFSSEYVNIGLDEAYGLGRFQLEEYCQKHGKDTLFMEHLNRVAENISQKYGKKVQFWSDMIINYPQSFSQIPEDATVLEWGYEVRDERLMQEHCQYLREKNVSFYVCPSCNTHFSLTGRFEVAAYNIRTSAELGRMYGAKGAMLTDWSMDQEGHPHFLVWSLMPIALGGQHFWNIEEEQNCGVMETCFERYSADFLDQFVFGGEKVGKYLHRLANYSLLEPERVRLGTMCGMTLWQDLDQTSYGAFFDLKACGDAFYFDNVIRYVNEILADVKKLSIDDYYKREIIMNSDMVVLAAEFCKLRMGAKIGEEKIRLLIDFVDSIDKEFRSLWLERNYEEGISRFLEVLSARKRDLTNMLSQN